MPELPELEALVEALEPLVTRSPVRDVPVAHFAVVKTATPPLDWLAGHRLTTAVRRGKHLVFPTDDDLVLTIHLMTAGKMHYAEPGAKRPPGPVLAVRFEDEGEPLDPSFDDAALAAALAKGGQLHTLLRDQHALVGIGRAYANEILHAAQLAPFTPADRLSPEERARLLEAIRSVLTDGIERFRPRGPHMLAKKHSPEIYDIHGHAGESCPRCGSMLMNVDFADHQVVYCPSCQTGGQIYADRRRSRLLK